MFEEKRKHENEARILYNATRRISNLMKLSRYGEAEETARQLAGILRTFELQKQLRKPVVV